MLEVLGARIDFDELQHPPKRPFPEVLFQDVDHTLGHQLHKRCHVWNQELHMNTGQMGSAVIIEYIFLFLAVIFSFMVPRNT